jgi:hypothetical protein
MAKKIRNYEKEIHGATAFISPSITNLRTNRIISSPNNISKYTTDRLILNKSIDKIAGSIYFSPIRRS